MRCLCGHWVTDTAPYALRVGSPMVCIDPRPLKPPFRRCGSAAAVHGNPSRGACSARRPHECGTCRGLQSTL